MLLHPSLGARQDLGRESVPWGRGEADPVIGVRLCCSLICLYLTAAPSRHRPHSTSRFLGLQLKVTARSPPHTTWCHMLPSTF